uniref:Uncharacterized protein n=1 Tax=Timema shepardi TaxID=629360 RepID=A0A7R9AW12_TIMSH|nr:unnamed protein product [Timema shepardi]
MKTSAAAECCLTECMSIMGNVERGGRVSNRRNSTCETAGNHEGGEKHLRDPNIYTEIPLTLQIHIKKNIFIN